MVNALLGILCVCLVGWGVTAVCMAREVFEADRYAQTWRQMMLDAWDREPTNPHARMLGRVVEARRRDGRWEKVTVVAVSHKGALAVRRLGDPNAKARWIPKYKVEERVREI